jgi:hypothetical protein
MAALPASSVAQSHRVPGDHHGQRHHERSHTERFGERHRETAAHPSAQDVGKVTSLESHVLTITLNDGSRVSGTVTAKTAVVCRGMNEEFALEDRGRDAGAAGGDNGGRRGDDGDRGDRGDDRGDDIDRGDRGDDRGDDIDPGDRGDDRGHDIDPGNRGDDNATEHCSMTLSTPGTPVRAAALRVSGAGSVWQSVQLDA